MPVEFTIRFLSNDAPVLIPGSDAAWTVNHAATARTFATEYAREAGEPMKVMAGARCAYVIEPDGTRKPPPEAKVEAREDCKRGTGVACFCSPCRAARRAAR